jgi:hypothetical protein
VARKMDIDQSRERGCYRVELCRDNGLGCRDKHFS